MPIKHTEGIVRFEKGQIGVGESYCHNFYEVIATMNPGVPEYQSNAEKMVTSWNEYDNLKEENKKMKETLTTIVDNAPFDCGGYHRIQEKFIDQAKELLNNLNT